MEIRLLGGPTGEGGSPRLYATDRKTDLVQGWKTEQPGQVEIPHRLLRWMEPGTCLTGLMDTGHGTFLLRGTPVTDRDALAVMAIPGHETAVEVPVSQEVFPDALDFR
ncbi:hypothetical protein BJY24_003994 [Nocardia transvalensis]|uniref:Uncharacterized protein n=1 Tax=Nocardia transvalensis TaxID=37333 RepID=A0A7W9PFD5_9NOCA|nr:hypothetical protein [Nocardia transvalensis]MBB5915127.1 hypothetical protein [Nocardia transvalensis]